MFDLKIPWIVIKLFVTSIWNFIRNFKSIPIFLPNLFNFRLTSLIFHVNDAKIIQKFQNQLLRPPAVYIYQIWASYKFFFYIFQILVLSHQLFMKMTSSQAMYPKKSVCHRLKNIMNTLKHKVAKNFPYWKFARVVTYSAGLWLSMFSDQNKWRS